MSAPATTPAAAAMRTATQRAFGTPATHMHRPGFAGPLCGQVSATGRGWARTHYTSNPDCVTCRKCRKALDKAAAEAANHTTD